MLKRKTDNSKPVVTRKPRAKKADASGDAWEGELEKGLSAIYQPEDGEEFDVSKIEPHRRRWGFVLFGSLMAFLLLLIAAVWLGSGIFKPFQDVDGDGLRVSIEGPSEVLLGQETTYFLKWRNASSNVLANADLRASFPRDFLLTAADPRPAAGSPAVWKLNLVPPEAEGSIILRGVFSGALGTHTAIQVLGSYRLNGANSDLETLTTREVEYSGSVVRTVFDMPAKTLPGDKVTIDYQLGNVGSVPLAGLEARITIPPGFVPVMTSGTALGEDRTFKLPVGDLAVNATNTVSVVGSFSSDFSGAASFHAEAGKPMPDGTFQVVQKMDGVMDVLAGDLSLNLVANGVEGDRAIDFAQVQHLSLGFENASPEELRDLVLKIAFEPVYASGTAPVIAKGKKPAFVSMLTWSDLEQASSGTVMGDSILWDKKSLASLEKVAPNQEGLIEFSVPVLSVASSTPGLVGISVTAQASMTVGSTKTIRTVQTKPMQLRLRSDAKAVAEIRYSSEEGAPVGSGPLPPVVGKPTTYRLEWNVTKSTRELKDVKFTTILPKQVEWTKTATTTAGELSFDGASRTLTWSMTRVPENAKEETAFLMLRFTPTDADVGRFAPLVGTTRFEATDAAINERLVQVRPALTTDLQNDDAAKLKGVVRKP